MFSFHWQFLPCDCLNAYFRNIEKRMKKSSRCLWFLCQLLKGCTPVMSLHCHLLPSPALRPPGPSSALGIAREATFRRLCKWECWQGKEKPGNPPVRKSCTGTASDSAVVYASSHVCNTGGPSLRPLMLLEYQKNCFVPLLESQNFSLRKDQN